jgi:hypothetical protein
MKVMGKLFVCLSVIASPVVADVSILEKYETTDQVIAAIPEIISEVAKGKFSSIDFVILEQDAALVGDLRTTLGVTNYDTSPEFKGAYWEKFNKTFGEYRVQTLQVQPNEKAQLGQYVVPNKDDWVKYFQQSFEGNRSNWDGLMAKSGIVDEGEKARALASVAYFAALGQRTSNAQSPEELLAAFPTYIWPWCTVAPQ